jgi:hypothetical protein
VHEFFRLTASVTVQVTEVTPTGKADPLTGAHATVVGGVPPVAVAAPYDTVTGNPVFEAVETGAGQIT